ncbi:HEAT repeat domain-containing protein [Nocardia mexicana]|uniref:HEAT repeat domain-containing protein n=1 Tax=Nocardia mexicana TaxID=279262 RepID=UPI00082C29F3|nr:HEAT repeat domain-containing protein [Nocardia mexicana]
METESPFQASRSPSWEKRRAAAWSLGELLPDPAALECLFGLLDDEDTAVEQDVAEVLVRRGGRAGLSAVLSNLGQRVDDPDADYIAYRLRELQLFEEVPVLQTARQVGDQNASSEIRDGLRQLEELFGSDIP